MQVQHISLPAIDPRQELQSGMEEYLELIKEVLERAKVTKSKQTKAELFEIVQQMLENYERLNQAKRVVLGIPPNA